MWVADTVKEIQSHGANANGLPTHRRRASRPGLRACQPGFRIHRPRSQRTRSCRPPLTQAASIDSSTPGPVHAARWQIDAVALGPPAHCSPNPGTVLLVVLNRLCSA